VLTGIVSVQFGAAIADKLFSTVPPAAVTALRLWFAALFLILVGGRGAWSVVVSIVRRRAWSDGWTAVGFGVALPVMNYSIYQAFARIPLGVAVTIEFLGPLGVSVAQSRHKRDLAWVTLGALGVVLLSGGAGGHLDLVGVAFALLAGACWAAYILLSRANGQRFSGSAGLVIAMTVAAVLVTPFGVGHRAMFGPKVVGEGAAIGVLSSVVPYWLELEVLRRIPARVFGVWMSLEPAVAALIGLILLNQHLSAVEWLAIACVIVASAGASRLTRGRLPSDGNKPSFSAHLISAERGFSVTIWREVGLDPAVERAGGGGALPAVVAEHVGHFDRGAAAVAAHLLPAEPEGLLPFHRGGAVPLVVALHGSPVVIELAVKLDDDPVLGVDPIAAPLAPAWLGERHLAIRFRQPVQSLHVAGIPVFQRRVVPGRCRGDHGGQVGAPAHLASRLDRCEKSRVGDQIVRDRLSDPAAYLVECVRRIAEIQQRLGRESPRRVLLRHRRGENSRRPVDEDAAGPGDTTLGGDGHVDHVCLPPDLDAVQAGGGLVAEHRAAAGVEQCGPPQGGRPQIAGVGRVDTRMDAAPGPAPDPAVDRVGGEAGPECLSAGEGAVLEPDKVPQGHGELIVHAAIVTMPTDILPSGRPICTDLAIK
jgi:inner membrane transporter RhtA